MSLATVDLDPPNFNKSMVINKDANTILSQAFDDPQLRISTSDQQPSLRYFTKCSVKGKTKRPMVR